MALICIFLMISRLSLFLRPFDRFSLACWENSVFMLSEIELFVLLPSSSHIWMLTLHQMHCYQIFSRILHVSSPYEGFPFYTEAFSLLKRKFLYDPACVHSNSLQAVYQGDIYTTMFIEAVFTIRFLILVKKK